MFLWFTWAVASAEKAKRIRLRITDKRKIYFIPGRIFVVIFVFSFVYAIRGLQVGTDTVNYYTMVFNNDRGMPSIEIGFDLLFGISKALFSNYNVCLFFIELFIICLSTLAICRASDKTRNAICLCIIFLANYFSPAFNIVRQMCAVAIVLVALTYLEENKILKFCLLILLATSFHTAAIICFSFLLIYYCGINKSKWLRSITVIVMICIFILEPLIYERMITSELFAQYRYYANQAGVSSYLVFLIYKIPIIILILISLKRLLRARKMNFVYLVLVLCEILSILLSLRTEWGFRIMYYFMGGEMMLVSQVPDLHKGKCKVYKNIIIGYYLFYFVYLTYFRGLDGIYPYITCFQ